MHLSRRRLLQSATAATLAAALPSTNSEMTPSRLPVTDQFVVPDYEVCLNNARWHPMSRGAVQAVHDYLDYKARGMNTQTSLTSPAAIAVKRELAALVQATPEEIAFVNSTTAAENLVVQALGLDRPGQFNIVTDALHFEGSLYLYQELARRGVNVRIVRPREWSVPQEEIEKAIDANTRLVAVSAVSFINGFQHNLKAISAAAHAQNALLYVDGVQAAGAIPVDARALGADFFASASYKWLMGDFGLGFLYVRRELLSRLRRPQLSFRQVDNFNYHAFPGDPAGAFPASYEQHEDAAGYFEVGTYANTVLAALSYSVPWIRSLGPEKIQQHALELNAMLRKEMPRLGYPCITPDEARGPIIAFAVKDDRTVASKLKSHKVDVGLNPGRLRVSPSIYNTPQDVQALLSALS